MATVNSVTFLAAVGGDGSTVTDDANTTTGLANGGHRLRFVPALSNIVKIAAFLVQQAQNAAASAASAVNAPGTNGTTTTALTIVSSGSITFTTQTGKNFVVGQSVSVASAANPSTARMVGVVTAYTSSSGSMTVAVGNGVGSGSFSDGVIGLSADAATLNALTALQTRVNNLETSVVYDGEDAFSFGA